MGAQTIAIDIGSENITVYVKNKGIVFCQPSCVLIDSHSKKVMASGLDALKYKGKHNSATEMIYHIKDGKIIDFENSILFFKKLIDRICFGKILRPDILICVPENISELDIKTIKNVLTDAGAGKTVFINRCLASLTGAGYDVFNSKGMVICDIGSNYTQCSVIASGRIILSETRDVGSNDFSNGIKEYLFHKRNILIPDITADELKINLGTVLPRNEEISVEICGKNTITANPENVEITSNEILNSFEKYTDIICDALKTLLENSSPELCSDILENGIVLTGQAANLFGLDLLITKTTKIKTVKPDSPDLCAALGMGTLLKNYGIKKLIRLTQEYGQ